MMNDTGQLIRKIRKSMNMTQAELAEKAGLYWATISNAERNRPIRLSTLEKIIKVFRDTSTKGAPK